MTLFWRNLTIVYLIADIKCIKFENVKMIAIPKCIAEFKEAVNSFHFSIKVSIVSTVCRPINVLYSNVEGENFD